VCVYIHQHPIQVGDKIVAVNGANVSALSLERVRELMGDRSEKVVRLDLLRSQTPFQVILFWDQNRNQSHTSSHGPSSRHGSRPGSTMVYTSNRSNLLPNTWIAPPPGGLLSFFAFGKTERL